MTFKDEFVKTPAGPKREQLVYRALASQGKPSDLWAVTVPGPGGSQITYNITRDFLNVNGFYTPMTGTTAQKLADYFGMYLPTNKIADQVWKAAGAKINVNPLSGTGYQGTDKFYSPQEVVSSRIGASDAAAAFNEKIQQARAQNPDTQNKLVDIGSGVKWLTVPPASGSLGLHGIRTPDGGTVQGGYGTKHPNYEDHTEYGTFVRLVDRMVTITKSNGEKKTIPMEEFATLPEASAIFEPSQDLRGNQLAKYDLKRDRAQLAKIDSEVGPPKDGATQVAQTQPGSLQGVNNLLNEISKELSASPINKLLMKYAGIQIMPSIGKDPAIKDLSKNSIPGRAPVGYRPLRPGENNKNIGAAATKILNSSELGDQTPFTIDDQSYLGRTEPHFHPPPPQGTDPSEFKKYPKPWGWHKGVTVFKAVEDKKKPSTAENFEPPVPSSIQTRKKILQRIQDSPANSLDMINNIFSEIEKDI